MRDVIFAIIATVILGVFACGGFYYAFKRYENNEDNEFDPIDFDPAASGPILFGVILFMFSVILCISKKVFPYKVHLAVVRTFAFIIGLIFLIPIFLIWLFVLKT